MGDEIPASAINNGTTTTEDVPISAAGSGSKMKIIAVAIVLVIILGILGAYFLTRGPSYDGLHEALLGEWKSTYVRIEQNGLVIAEGNNTDPMFATTGYIIDSSTDLFEDNDGKSVYNGSFEVKKTGDKEWTVIGNIKSEWNGTEFDVDSVTYTLSGDNDNTMTFVQKISSTVDGNEINYTYIIEWQRVD